MHIQPKLYETPSGLGGSFTVSIVKEFDADTVQVRVHYPTKEWDGHTFTTKRAALRDRAKRVA